MKTFNPDWQQPGDALYPPPADTVSRQPMIRIKDSTDMCAAARWPEPYGCEEIDIWIGYVDNLAGIH